MSRTRFRMNPRSIVAWMSRKADAKSEVLDIWSFSFCFEQGVPWHSSNYRVGIHSETRTWHDNKTAKSTVQISTHNTAQSFEQFGLMVECFLWTTWLRVRVQLKSLNLQIRACFKQGVPWHSGQWAFWPTFQKFMRNYCMASYLNTLTVC